MRALAAQEDAGRVGAGERVPRRRLHRTAPVRSIPSGGEEGRPMRGRVSTRYFESCEIHGVSQL